MKTPGEVSPDWRDEENGVYLEGSEATQYRALAARANYLAQDRSDIQYAAKEICRGMARPTRGNLRDLRRLGRYLVGEPRVVWRFEWQDAVRTVSAYSDSDWAGCRRTARSTSGGALMLGHHCLRTYSVTQKFVTLSSGEAELMALVRAATEAIGMTQLAEGWGLSFDARVLVDSSAALAVTARRGNGKLRHVRIGHLWVQEKAADDEVQFCKVAGTLNPADLCTKHLPAPTRCRLVGLLSQYSCHGTASGRLHLSGVAPLARSLSLSPLRPVTPVGARAVGGCSTLDRSNVHSASNSSP